MHFHRNLTFALASLLSLTLFLSPVMADTTMTRIRNNQEIRVGFRADAFPFSYIDSASGRYVGFSVDMANLLATNLSKRFGCTVRMRPIAVTANSRITFIQKGLIDIEMGVSSLNQTREEEVDFSLIYFISETTFLYAKNSGILSLSDLNKRVLGASKGTTNLDELNKLVAAGRLVPQAIVLMDSHAEGMKALQKGMVDAYCSDRILLDVMRRQGRNPDDWVVLDSAVAYEPYAFMLQEGNSDFRDFINDTIRWAVTSGRFDEIYDQWMGSDSVSPYKMPPGLREYLRVVVYPMSPTWWRQK